MSLYQKVYKLFGIVRRPLFFKALFNGVAAAVEHERILKNLSCRTVVDIGANRGQFALVTRYCFPEARILSFEPLSLPAKTFQKLMASDDKVRLHTVGIAPERGTSIVHVSAQDDSSSLLPITQLQTSLFPGTSEVRTETVKVEPLAECVEEVDIVQPALLKLDVQGYELKALEGCTELLPLFNYVYVECSFVELYAGQALANEVIEYLQRKYYKLRGIYNVIYDRQGQAIQADFLFAS